jgi:hypothetical protein
MVGSGSIFDMGGSDARWGRSQVRLLGQVRAQAPEPMERVVARPAMGQEEKPASAFPSVEKILKKQVVGVSLSKAEASAILDALIDGLVRVGAVENSGVPCVTNLGPGMVEKAVALRSKLATYVSDGQGEFSDMTASELEGADKVLACAALLTPSVSSMNLGGWLVVGALAIGAVVILSGAAK